MRAPLEHVCRQLHGADVERAIALVYSLLHKDLVASTLALLVHVLPRTLGGKASSTSLLSHPTSHALAWLTVQGQG